MCGGYCVEPLADMPGLYIMFNSRELIDMMAKVPAWEPYSYRWGLAYIRRGDRPVVKF